MKRKFLRQDITRHSKLGKGRKKLQKWRRPKGRHSKMRRKRFSYPKSPSIGYKTPKSKAGKIMNLIPKLVHNIKELENANSKTDIVIIAKIGARKKLDIIKKADEMKIKIFNINKEKKK
jgi:large subunit ribosomal protein L32e